MANILVIDDDPSTCELLLNLAREMEHRVTAAETLQDGLSRLSSGTFDVVFLSAGMPYGGALKPLLQIRDEPSSPEVVIMIHAGDLDGAEWAIQHGAWDYLQKPLNETVASRCLIQALQYRREKEFAPKPGTLKREGIVGNSPKMNACLSAATQVADSDATVLILGETGTGKELMAWAVHASSRRAHRNFVVVDCASLPENLVESILFGHERGAFTGADKNKTGLIQQADGGTLFLDEVGELPLSIQKSFLRVLHGKTFRPVGGKDEVACDFRLIAASNRNLDEMVREGQFRDDLLFRLRSFQIELPPLRERVEDIEELLMFYLAELCERHGIERKEFSPEFIGALKTYSWPGNIREFVNALERALVAARHEGTLFPKHLPPHLRVRMAKETLEGEKAVEPVAGISEKTFPKLKDLRQECLDGVEKNYLEDLVAFTQGNIREACRISGLSRSRLYLLLKKHQIPTSG